MHLHLAIIGGDDEPPPCCQQGVAIVEIEFHPLPIVLDLVAMRSIAGCTTLLLHQCRHVVVDHVVAEPILIDFVNSKLERT